MRSMGFVRRLLISLVVALCFTGTQAVVAGQDATPDRAAISPMRNGDDQKVLDSLYSDLAKAPDEFAAKRLTDSILKIWLHSGSDTVDLLTVRANKAMQAQDDKIAEELLDSIVDIAPNFVEGWNRRATFYFTKKDYTRSMADVQRVLTLDPKHFGALSGMGAILQDTGQDAAALDVFREALKVHPFLPGARRAVEKLQLEVEGRNI